MEILIGIRDSHRELQLETEDSADQVRSQLEAAYADGRAVLWLTDSKGREVGVPLGSLSYMELIPAGITQRVGFNSES